MGGVYLSGGRLQVGDEVSAIPGLLETGEHHLGSRDVLLRVEKVFEEGVFIPGDSLGNVGLGVREPGGLAGFAPEQTVEVGSNLVPLALL